MFEFHRDKETYFDYQYKTARDYIIPFLESEYALEPDQKILEIGCAEAGVLKAFIERGHSCVGIELWEHRIELAESFMQEEVREGKVRFIAGDILEMDIHKDIGHTFDLIILKDVIEHIPDQEALMRRLKDFLSPNGKIFLGFPPWSMPFGGHQQVCKSKVLSSLPYYHLLPTPVYKGILKSLGESDQKVSNLLEIKDCGISTRRFEKIAKQEDYKLLQRQLFLINPIYKYKFNLKPRKQQSLISGIPVLRDFVSTCAYYLVGR